MERTYPWLGLAVTALCGCFFLGYSAPSSPKEDAAPEERAVTGLNLDGVTSDRAPLRSAEVLHDAVASVVAPSPVSVAPAPPVPAVPAPNQAFFAELMAGPVDFIAKKTLLGKADGFEKFANDSSRVDRYLRHPIIRGVLDNPRLLKPLLSSRAVINGFLGSPAMQDSKAVSALANSVLLKRLSQDPGVQNVLKEPGMVNQLFMNPDSMSWFMRHPEGMKAVATLSPEAARVTGRFR